ncbi:sensor histidine kinase [Dongia mobilis]|uniref:sensor histidine kinase n=1 Tax=Dongia mobilis TaxID=578943 RepID=UPI00105D3D6B|nr:ATP-binding protein [Dongia mobilis]
MARPTAAGDAAIERERLDSLHRRQILDTAPEPSFDDLTILASEICAMPIAVISLVDADRLWFKSRVGIEISEMPREGSFCDYAISDPDFVEVQDLAADPRFAGHPMVAGTPQLRFYAAAQIKSGCGLAFGTLSVMDVTPRRLDARQRASLIRLANQCSNLIELRTVARQLENEIAHRTEALNTAEAQFRGFLQNAPINMSVKCLDGRYMIVNPAIGRFYGVHESELIGKHIRDIAAPEMAAVVEAADATVLGTGKPLIRESRYLWRGRELWFHEIKFPIRDAEGRTATIGSIGIDITDSKLGQEELIEAKERAEAASQAKSQFLANMSHELRTPLNAILGFSEIIAQQAIGPVSLERIRAYAADIHQSGQLLMKIINDILDLSKIEAGRVTLTDTTCDLGEIVRTTLNLIDNAAQTKNLRVSNLLPGNLPPIRADERALTQVLLNLVNNAIKFTLPGGEITVEATLLSDGIALSVTDTGIGIAADDIPLVFTAFGQVEDAFARGHEGAGLGLPIARALIELMDGKLDLHSRLGIGTRVTIWLPASRLLASSAA